MKFILGQAHSSWSPSSRADSRCHKKKSCYYYGPWKHNKNGGTYNMYVQVSPSMTCLSWPGPIFMPMLGCFEILFSRSMSLSFLIYIFCNLRLCTKHRQFLIQLPMEFLNITKTSWAWLVLCTYIWAFWSFEFLLEASVRHWLQYCKASVACISQFFQTSLISQFQRLLNHKSDTAIARTQLFQSQLSVWVNFLY